MTARQLLVQQLADLSDEDVHALLPIVERLRAKHIALASAPATQDTPPPTPPQRRHPERFGRLAGSARFVDDLESPVENADAWTCDEENLKP
ncbi:hypothetical protein [Sorangium sp. So ce1097]|uniref:hypothetical protein n=1 Tax=Sorangium sp. So ce1097 TaxID=3133330 RepID=UPI003F5E4003